MTEKFPMTIDGLKKLKLELDQLKNIDRQNLTFCYRYQCVGYHCRVR